MKKIIIATKGEQHIKVEAGYVYEIRIKEGEVLSKDFDIFAKSVGDDLEVSFSNDTYLVFDDFYKICLPETEVELGCFVVLPNAVVVSNLIDINTSNPDINKTVWLNDESVISDSTLFDYSNSRDASNKFPSYSSYSVRVTEALESNTVTIDSNTATIDSNTATSIDMSKNIDTSSIDTENTGLDILSSASVASVDIPTVDKLRLYQELVDHYSDRSNYVVAGNNQYSTYPNHKWDTIDIGIDGKALTYTDGAGNDTNRILGIDYVNGYVVNIYWIYKDIDIEKAVWLTKYSNISYTHILVDESNMVIKTEDMSAGTRYDGSSMQPDNIAIGVGADYIKAGSGNDYIKGMLGNDNLDGSAGNDIIVGGAGDDILTGGSGYDFFRYENYTNYTNGDDTITDFRSTKDAIVLEDVLQVYDKTSNINEFISIVYANNNATINIDKNGTVGGESVDMSITLNDYGIGSLDVETMIEDGSILIL